MLNSLLAYWKLDDTSGDFQDSTASGIVLADVGEDSADRGVAGKIGNCAGNNGGFVGLSAVVGDVLDGGFSISFWIKSSTTDYFMLAAKASPGYHGFLIAAQPGGEDESQGLCFVVYTGDVENDGGYYGIVCPSICDGGWHHIVCVYTEDSIGIYGDGELIDSLPCAYGMSPSASDLVLFNNNDLNCAFSGSLDEVGIWTRLLSATEVGQLYHNGNGRAFDTF